MPFEFLADEDCLELVEFEEGLVVFGEEVITNVIVVLVLDGVVVVGLEALSKPVTIVLVESTGRREAKNVV